MLSEKRYIARYLVANIAAAWSILALVWWLHPAVITPIVFAAGTFGTFGGACISYGCRIRPERMKRRRELEAIRRFYPWRDL